MLCLMAGLFARSNMNIDFEELNKFVLSKRPTLKGKDYRIAF